MVERYSDSAAAYIVLDPTNSSVYKQLFRAAKAKQKLKLRMSHVPTPIEESIRPKPVTVEDEPESAEVKQEELSSSQEDSKAPSAPAPVSTKSSATITAPQVVNEFPEFIKEWHSRGMPRIHLRRDDSGTEVIDFLGQASNADPMVELANTEAASASDKSLPVDTPQYCFKQAAEDFSFDELRHIGAAAETALRPGSSLHAAVCEDPSRQSQKSESAPIPVATAPKQQNVPQCPAFSSRFRRPFTVCCNSCDRAVPDAHFHCSTCDDGDFDLCQDCVNQGISCYNDQHWLIKRTIQDGQIAYSTTHVAPKMNRVTPPVKAPKELTGARGPAHINLPIRRVEVVQPRADNDFGSFAAPLFMARTCNSCVQEFPEKEFLHCAVCEDFDLCKSCFSKDLHGHHPKHEFTPAVQGTMFDSSIVARLNAGRNVRHHAICDGCNHYIRGIRHKCLDCPDWDYCSDCAQNAGFIHPNHRFAPIFEPLPEAARVASRSVHNGICCDGPLCTSSRSGSRYIVGIRYKCAVCHDTDFCAGCEASPANTHNKTHPLIKFKSPVRHVSVTTTGEHQDGQRLPAMGDRSAPSVPYVLPKRTSNRSTETVPSPSDNIAVNPVRTVVDVKPSEAPVATKPAKQEIIEKEAVESKDSPIVAEKQQVPEPDLVAVFKRDTIEDGTVMLPNHTFEQTWVLRNEGKVAWPAGCSVKFVGGDYMGAVDPTRPTGVRELISASESTICYNKLEPGQEYSFTVLMRTPEREGKVISYWRLTTRDGAKFGHKLWCDVTVESPREMRQVSEDSLLDTEVPEMARSQMIIPKLDHESPASSVLVSKDESELDVATETDTLAPSTRDNDEEYEDCVDDEWAEETDGGFMTDEEYDILDASDEEYLFEQQEQVSKK